MGHDLSEIAKRIVGEVKAAAEDLSRLKGFSLNSLKGLIRVTPIVVKRVEAVGKEAGLAGQEKHALATEILLQVVPMPWYLSAIVRMILPAVIDMAVDALKDQLA